MDWLTIVVVVFLILGGVDYLIGNRFGVGEEFKKGISMLGPMTLTMSGMLILAPAISYMLQGMVVNLPDFIDPSIIASSLLANDMGGAPLSVELCRNNEIGMFNAMVVSSMMGCTVSFTIPVALGIVDKKYHKDMILGILCGIVTIPFGAFVGGLIAGINFLNLIKNLIPLIVFSLLIAVALFKIPDVCIKVFSVIGSIINILIIIGLVAGIFEFLTGIKVIPHTDTLENSSRIVINASCVMAGMFPLVKILSQILKKLLCVFSEKAGINETAAMGFMASLATSFTTYNMVKDMDRKGIILNSAFFVSGGFVLAGHMAFTLAYNPDYVLSVVAGKLTAGVVAVILALAMYNMVKDK